MKPTYILLFFSLLCASLPTSAQNFDLKETREAYKINELGLSSFELYFTDIFNIHGQLHRNPNVEKETNGNVKFSRRLKNVGVLKEAWRNYPVYFSSIQFAEGATDQNYNIKGTKNTLTTAITELMKAYFKNNLGFSMLDENDPVTLLEMNMLKDPFFRPDIITEAAKLFTRKDFEKIISAHTNQRGINVVSFYFEQSAFYTKNVHISTYVFLNDVLLFTTTINLDLCKFNMMEVIGCDVYFDLDDFQDEKYLLLLIHTMFENIHTN